MNYRECVRGGRVKKDERRVSTRLEAAIQRKGRIMAIWVLVERGLGAEGGYIYETGARRLGGGRWVVRRHGRENDMMSSSPIRGPSRPAKACAKRVRTKI